MIFSDRFNYDYLGHDIMNLAVLLNVDCWPPTGVPSFLCGDGIWNVVASMGASVLYIYLMGSRGPQQINFALRMLSTGRFFV